MKIAPLSFSSVGTTTGRISSAMPAYGNLPSSSRSLSMLRLTPRQREVLGMLVNDQLNIHGHTFTRDELLRVFSGQQRPRDPAVCEFLGLTALLNADYSSLEKRVLAMSL